MKLSDYTIDASHTDWSTILAHWAWLLQGIDELEVWIVTRFGDLVCCLSDGSVHFLDVSEGSFKRVASSKDEFASLMDQCDNFHFWFLVPLVDELTREGILLGPSQCYGFRAPLGFKEGRAERANVKVTDLPSYLTAMGDLWGKLQNEPDGTKIRLQPRK